MQFEEQENDCGQVFLEFMISFFEYIKAEQGVNYIETVKEKSISVSQSVVHENEQLNQEILSDNDQAIILDKKKIGMFSAITEKTEEDDNSILDVMVTPRDVAVIGNSEPVYMSKRNMRDEVSADRVDHEQEEDEEADVQQVNSDVNGIGIKQIKQQEKPEPNRQDVYQPS